MITTKLFSGMKLLNAKGDPRTIREIIGDTVHLTYGTWERVSVVTEKWTAVPESAPVERALRDGWTLVKPGDVGAECLNCGDFCAARNAMGLSYCEPCAEYRGAFLDAIKVTFTDTGSQPGTFGAPAKPDWKPGMPNEPKPPLGAASVVEAPRCVRQASGIAVCSGPLLMRHMNGEPADMTCDGHYLENEREDELLTADIDDNNVKARCTTRPPGLVPQSFGDERIGGVWASRGMVSR